MKVNGDILTKTELEAKQIAALRSRINTAVDAEAMKNDETLKKMIAEVTPKILVETIDEMLLLQLGKEKGISRHRSAVQGVGRRHPERPESRGRSEVQAGARTGRHDDGRSAAQFRAPGHRLSCSAGRSRAEAADHRGRSAPVLSLAPVGVRRTRNGHAPRDLGRDSDGYQGRAGGYQRCAGRCGAERRRRRSARE